MKNQQETAKFNVDESQYEKFNFLKDQFREKSRRWDFFSQILQERVKIEEQYTKGIEDILQRLEDFVFEGVFASCVSTMKAIDEKRVKLGRKIMLSLKANVIGAGNLVMEGANNEIKKFSGQKKELTNELQSRLEALGQLKSEYTSQTKDYNLAGIEYECLKLQRDAPKDKKSQCFNKYQKLADQLKDTESKYLNAIGEYNCFVDKMESCIGEYNIKLIDVEAKRIKFIQESLFKVWNESKDDLLDYQKSLSTTIHQALNKVDIDSEVQSLMKGFHPLKGFPPKIEQIRLKTFIQEGLIGVNASPDTYEENILADFRKFYGEIMQNDSQDQSKRMDLDCITTKDNDDLTFFGYFLHDSWKGKPMVKEDIARFKQCTDNQLFRKAFIGAAQQYRLFGKFVLNEDGYNNLAILLICILKQLMDTKDAQSVTKLLILSFTFWKEIKKENDIERKYIQSEIAWHPVWKDLDFWITAIFVSIHEEISKQNSLNLKESETQKESVEREQNTVFGQLLNFGHNMVAFMIKVDDAKLVIGQFCKLFSFRDMQIQKVMEFGPKKTEKVDFIMDYFAPKTPVKEPVKNSANDDVMDNVRAFLNTVKGSVKIECSSRAMQKAKNAYESKKKLKKGDIGFILNIDEGEGLDDSTEISEMLSPDN